MISVITKFIDETSRVVDATYKATVRALQKAAYSIFKSAQESIEESSTPSAPGEPPHTRSGQLKRAIRYEVDKAIESAVIGPRASMVGTSAMAQEFGGDYKGQHYPERPFMGPALQRNLHLIAAFWQSEVTQ